MVERTITATIAAHPDCGVALWPPRRLRDMEGFQATTRRLDADAEPINKAAAVALETLASRISAEMAEEQGRRIKTLILSEENFIGGMRNNFRSGKFYPDVAQRLAAFDILLPISPNTIALGVRDYGTVWTSAYNYLPQTGHNTPPLGRVRGALLDGKRGWPKVALAARDVWPDAALLMWQQEHLEQDIANICAQVSGLDRDMIVVPEGRINARTLDDAQQEVFSVEERKHLTKRYNRHIRRMKTEGVAHWVGGVA